MITEIATSKHPMFNCMNFLQKRCIDEDGFLEQAKQPSHARAQDLSVQSTFFAVKNWIHKQDANSDTIELNQDKVSALAHHRPQVRAVADHLLFHEQSSRAVADHVLLSQRKNK